MKTLISPSTISQYESMGFSPELIKMAWEACNSESDMMDTLIQLSSQNRDLQQTGPNKQDDEMALNQALLESFKTHPQSTGFEIVSPEQRLRQGGVPCGLKNVGNTCYFNGLLQTYFYNSEFVRIVLQYQPTKQTQSVKLVQNLQNLFLSMIGSDKKYVDPSEVVKSICDDFGNVLPIGDQKDVGEFNHYFLSRIGEGLADQPVQELQEQPHQQSSILRLKSSTIQDNDIVSKLFFTQAHKCLEFDQAGVPQKREGHELFNFIPLDLKDSNLYDSLDGFIINSVEDFKNDLSEIVHATNYNWIQMPPQTLSFQIQRVGYSKEKGELIKQNDEFYFEEEIYIDRFLIDNSKEYLDIRKKNSEHKNKQKKIKSDQHQLIKFNEQYDLEDVLHTVIKFLELQSSNDNGNPANFGKKEDQKTIDHLQQYSNQVLKRKQVLQKQYDDLEEKIQASYNNLRKHKYILQSILIHEGMANSGHYYTYIKDFGLNKWFKFNDIHVTETSREKVFLDAIGTKTGTNAYLLVYVRDTVVEQEQHTVMRTYKTSFDNDYLKDGYGNFLSPQQINSITQENKLFQDEIEDFKTARVVERVCESYQTRFEFVNEHFRVLSSKHQQAKFKPLFTLNFPMFLKSKSLLQVPVNISDNLLKWIILDSAIRDSRDDKLGIFDGQLSQNFQNKLTTKFAQQFTEFKRPKAQLTQQEQNDLLKFQQEYINYIQIGSHTQILNEVLLKEDYLSSIQMLYHLCKRVKMIDQNNYFYKVASNLSKIIPLIVICSMIPKQAEVDLQVLRVLQNYLIDQLANFQIITFWDPQISIMMNAIFENHEIQQVQQLIANFESKIISKEHYDLLIKLPEELASRVEGCVAQYDINFWSPYQKVDPLFENLIEAQNQIKVKFDVFLKIHSKLKTAEFPLMKDELEEMIKQYKI